MKLKYKWNIQDKQKLGLTDYVLTLLGQFHRFIFSLEVDSFD
jgi:hypothetical protein